MFKSILFSFFIVNGAALAQSNALVMTAEPYPAHGLPGVTPVFKVVLSNASSTSVTVAATTFCIEGLRANVKAFGCRDLDQAEPIINGGSDLADFAKVWFDRTSRSGVFDLGPHEQRTLWSTPDDGFFLVPELLQPGHYDLRVRMPSGEASNVFRYVVDEPQGADLVVWRRLLEVYRPTAGDEGPAPWLVDERMQAILQQYPDSVYSKIARRFRDALIPPRSMAEAVRRALRDVDSSAPEPYDTDFRLTLAGAYQANAQELAVRGLLDDAVKQADAGKTLLQTLAASQTNGYGRAGALAMLAQGPWTRAELTKYADRVNGTNTPPRKASEPRVDCVRINDDGTFTAWFGYTNPNSGIYLVPLGDKNYFDPAPESRGQPTVMQEGSQQRVFSVTAAVGDKLVWVLEGHRATATANEGTRDCPDGPSQKP